MSQLMPEIIALVINVAVAALLIAVMIYCNRLNKNIKVLQDSKGEMAKLFAEFDASIEKASESIEELQDATKRAEIVLKDKLDKANLVADDLTFMIERGIKMADTLEGGLKKPASSAAPSPVAAAKAAAPAPRAPQASAAVAPAQPQAAAAAADAKKWPLGGKNMTRGEANAVNAPASNSSAARTTASIESVLEQMANRNNPTADAAKAADPKKANNSRIRSKAEQELFDSLKSGR